MPLCHNFDHSFVKDVFVDADDDVTIVVTLVALLSLLSLLLSLKSFVGTKDKTFDSGHCTKNKNKRQSDLYDEWKGARQKRPWMDY